MDSATKPGTPTIERRPYASLSGDERDWLKARHHISFASNAANFRDRIGALRAWNDDEIAPYSGFPPHAHANMEIITYVREGVITHQDNLGNVGQTQAGNVQVMSAGTGIRHAEYNMQSDLARLFQIWIAPDRVGGAPSWGTRPFPKADRAGQFVVLASGYPEDLEALPIRARARVLGATLRTGESLRYVLESGRVGYLVVARGELEVNGIQLKERDGAAIKEPSAIILQASRDVELVLADVPA
jgi:redox-sensitive bicupin YhaK (pirin superfamily)